MTVNHQNYLLTNGQINNCIKFAQILNLNFAQLFRIKMQTETRSQRQLGKAYRQFSRKRYNQLKNASQQMRESQIVQKIIRQWDVMPMLDKNKWITMNQSELPATPMKTEHLFMKVDKANISNLKTTGNKKESQKNQEMDKQELAQDEVNIKQFDSNLFPKQKSIRKSKKLPISNDYMTFYRFYYQQLMKEHPSWTPNKTTIIIKLLWRKRKAEFSKKTGNIKTRITRRLSARMNFKKDKMKTGMEASKIVQIWKRLPMESRNLWNLDCHQVSKSKKECILHLKSSHMAQESAHNQFSFLSKK